MVINMEAFNLICKDKPGVLRDISGTVAKHNGNIKYVQLFIIERGNNKGNALVYMEIDV
ncbi:MAG: ACT domain-containing protein, partial [Methanocellales archaeon]|nr:ACT domain-containing protein [Methanocellales archaeon]